MRIIRRSPARLVAALAAIVFAVDAPAEIGVDDPAPAATLLVPYFEVDLDDPNGPQTRFSVNNVEAVPALAHVVLWTDLGRPTFAFDLYLGGYGSVEVDLRLAFAGVLPSTQADAFAAGGFSDPKADFPDCPAAPGAMYAGFPIAGPLAAETVAHLRAAHTGQPSDILGGQCTGAALGDGVARGYVTVDVVNRCSSDFPSDPGYFAAGGTGVAGNRNVLFGRYLTRERRDGVSFSGPLVAIEADATHPASSTPSEPTFYGAYVGYDASDNREPLGGVWQARHLGEGWFDPGATQIVAWRQPTAAAPFTCGTASIPGTPLTELSIVRFDEAENPTPIFVQPPFPNPPVPKPTLLARMTQAVPLSEFTPYAGGYLHMNLNATGLPPALDQAEVDERAQSYVIVRHRQPGVYAGDLPAVLLGAHAQMQSALACRQPFEPFCSDANIELDF